MDDNQMPRMEHERTLTIQTPTAGGGTTVMELDVQGETVVMQREEAQPAPNVPDPTEPPEDRYRFERIEGRGGMGTVMRVFDDKTDRVVALKMALGGEDGDSLTREGRLTARLQHPNIVPVYEVGAGETQPFYTMKLLEDDTLKAVLADIAADDEGTASRWPLTRLLEAFRQVCLAIQFAHEQRIIHRDLKPANIMLGKFGEVVVADWGIARSLDRPIPEEEDGKVLGTPAHLAPEQYLGTHAAGDTQTDIFALGTILFEILYLERPYPGDPAAVVSRQLAGAFPAPPDGSTPREVPKRLREICEKAMNSDRSERFGRADELAGELQSYLDQRRDRELRRERAERTYEEAQEAITRYRSTREHLETIREQLETLEEDIAPWAPEEEKIPILELYDRVPELEVRLERWFGDAVQTLEQVLADSDGHAGAARDLADLYWERLREAEEGGDVSQAAYFRQLLRRSAPADIVDRLDARAALELTSPTPGARATLFRFLPKHRRKVPTEVKHDVELPADISELPHGSYVALFEASGYAPARIPFVLKRGEARTIGASLHPSDAVPEGFVVVSGSAMSSSAEVGDFAMQRFPVTCGAYLEFMNAVREEDPERALEHAPMIGNDRFVDVDPQTGRLTVPAPDVHGDVWDPQWPIFIISHDDATAYARWRSERDGFDYRLPTEEEWTLAARGADGRTYPWGDHLDPSFCKMRESRPGRPKPEAVGTFEIDRSPFGIRDMAGCVCEWTSTPVENDQWVLKGGSFNSRATACAIDFRQRNFRETKFVHHGFRLMVDL